MQKKLPNFFIVGAAKSGTTFLWNNLKKNEQIFMPINFLKKEPGFFLENKGMKNIDNYLELFNDAKNGHSMIGEASTGYLTDPSSAKKIKLFNPDAKIIIILRNPVDRAFSLYRWMCQDGYEYAPTLDLAFKLEKKRKTKKIPNYFEPEYYYNYLYFESGLYFEQVQRYIDEFGRQKVKIYVFEDFLEHVNEYYFDLCKFLGVDYNKPLCDIKNQSKTVFLPTAQFFNRKINNYLVSKFFPKWTTKAQRDFYINLFIFNFFKKNVSNKLRIKLGAKYKEDIDKLSELTGVNFENWTIKNKL